MTEKKPQGHLTQETYRCEERYRYLGSSTSCVQEGKVYLDGLMLCEKHALEAKLEEQIACWSGLLAHIDL
jgi:hypothetical protein